MSWHFLQGQMARPRPVQIGVIMQQYDLYNVLAGIDPGSLTYDEWTWVGMAIKTEGGTWQDWDDWSARDQQRYHPGECEKKWMSFNGSATPRTMGTLVQLAKEQGWEPPRQDRPATKNIIYDDWDFVLPAPDKDYRIAATKSVDVQVPMEAPDNWNPAQQIIDYLNSLFFPEETIAYVLQSSPREDGGYAPKGSGIYSRTAGEVIDDLRHKPLEEALCGVYDRDAGAWIRINSFDGKGISDANVVTYRHVLVEADDWSIEDQLALYTAMELPVAALVNSGGKSLHAIVKVDATTRKEYDERVDFLFTVLEKNGLEKKARRNRNLSRLSRLPGIERGGAKQYLVATHKGKASWTEWRDWLEQENDNLPDFENWETLANNPPPLADELISGILRKGHKLLLAGPSKAGKSFLLLELALAVLEGKDWLGWRCKKGKVLYVNLELDPASCTHRLLTLDDVLGCSPAERKGLDLWNLRGLAAPLNVLAPKLIRRAIKYKYDLVILDPIYKVLTGSENEAADMAAFCNEFDKICRELGAAVVYCHHHSKGEQGQKASRDRASGSGVFARDPDAIIDLIELQISDEQRDSYISMTIARAMQDWLNHHLENWETLCSDPADWESERKLWESVAHALTTDQRAKLTGTRERTMQRLKKVSAWRVEGTLREFAPPDPVRIWFQHPLHVLDQEGMLTKARAAGEEPPWTQGRSKKRPTGASSENTDHQTVQIALASLTQLGSAKTASLSDLEESTGLSKSALDRVIKRNSFCVEIADGMIMSRQDFAAAARDSGKPYNEFAAEMGLKGIKNPKQQITKWVKKLDD